MGIRRVTDLDLPFLEEMTLLAAFAPGIVPEAAAAISRVDRWTLEWGRAGDAGVVAWRDGRRIGAAWCRLQPDALARDDAGAPLPEIAIAVSADQRSRGVGAGMLAALCLEAVAAGHSALSLTVNVANPALHLYQRAGFEVAERDGGRLTMVKRLSRVGH